MFPTSREKEESFIKRIAKHSLNLPKAPDNNSILDGRIYKKLIEENIDVCLQFPEIIIQKLKEVSTVNFEKFEQAKCRCQTRFACVESDCFEVAEILHERGLPCSMLNCASNRWVGGGFWNDKGTQEEALFRLSSIVLSLFPHRAETDNRVILRGLEDRNESIYPFPEFSALYSPNVLLLRQNQIDKSFREPPSMICISVISQAAYDLRVESFNSEGMAKKVYSIFQAAYENGDKNLVLSAIGCGGFRNDPKVVARIFRSILDDYFPNCFEHVIFAFPSLSSDPQADTSIRSHFMLQFPRIDGLSKWI